VHALQPLHANDLHPHPLRGDRRPGHRSLTMRADAAR
jgi:hypothetical protein